MILSNIAMIFSCVISFTNEKLKIVYDWPTNHTIPDRPYRTRPIDWPTRPTNRPYQPTIPDRPYCTVSTVPSDRTVRPYHTRPTERTNQPTIPDRPTDQPYRRTDQPTVPYQPTIPTNQPTIPTDWTVRTIPYHTRPTEHTNQPTSNTPQKEFIRTNHRTAPKVIPIKWTASVKKKWFILCHIS